VEEVCVRALCIVPLEQPAERFEAEQQATSHFVGSQSPDDMLVHRQDIGQAAVERTLLIDRLPPAAL